MNKQILLFWKNFLLIDFNCILFNCELRLKDKIIINHVVGMFCQISVWLYNGIFRFQKIIKVGSFSLAGKITYIN